MDVSKWICNCVWVIVPFTPNRGVQLGTSEHSWPVSLVSSSTMNIRVDRFKPLINKRNDLQRIPLLSIFQILIFVPSFPTSQKNSNRHQPSRLLPPMLLPILPTQKWFPQKRLRHNLWSSSTYVHGFFNARVAFFKQCASFPCPSTDENGLPPSTLLSNVLEVFLHHSLVMRTSYSILSYPWLTCSILVSLERVFTWIQEQNTRRYSGKSKTESRDNSRGS